MKEAGKSIFKKNEKFIVIGSVAFLFLLFNLYMPTIRSDDLVYLDRVNNLGYIGASLEHYRTWSSRILIELFLMFFSKHFLLWKILNSFVMLGTVLILCRYIFKKITIRDFLLVFSIYCLIPMTVMGETGWRATTLNYQWPVTFALVAFYPFYQLINQQKINQTIYFISIPFLVYAANQEQVNICYFVLTSILSIYLYSNKNYSLKLLPFTIISFVELVFSLTAPGNSVRSIQETARWFPEYKNFSMINKIDLGISSFGKPFFVDMNSLFFLFFLLVFILAYIKTNNYYVKIISAVPFFTNLLIYIGNTMNQSFTNVSGNSRAMIWDSGALEKLFSKTGTNLSLFYPGTWLATIFILGLLACLIFALYICFDRAKISLLMIVILLMGVCSRVIMGCSPTIWASGMRTYYILYVVIAVLVLMLLKELCTLVLPKKFELIQVSLTVIGFSTFLLTFFKKA